MSQPSPRVTASHPIVPIVRTPLPTAPFPACVPPLSVVIVTTPVPDSLLSLMDYCLPFVYCLTCLMYLLIVSIVFSLLLFHALIVLSLLIVLSGLLPSTG
jgi:hypothetical protein